MTLKEAPSVFPPRFNVHVILSINGLGNKEATYLYQLLMRKRNIFFKSNCQQDHRYQIWITEMPTAILLLPGNVTLGIASDQRKCFPSPNTVEITAI